MTLLSQAVDLIRTAPTTQAWPKMKEIADSAADTTPLSWEFPAIVCDAIGKDKELTVPAMAALGSIQLSIILIDDMLDEDPRGEYHKIGAGPASNLAAAFQALGLEIVKNCELDETYKQQAFSQLNAMALHTAHGQALDVLNPKNEEAYWQMVQAKSSPYYGAAFALGAIFSNSPMELVNKIEQLGRLYGEMIQIHDDTKDSLEQPINPDWVQGRYPLPILFASLVQHPELGEFQELHTHLSTERGADDEAALKRAQEILVNCGAIAYCMDQLVERYTEAQQLLEEIRVVNPEFLYKLIEELIDPLRMIVEDMETKIPELS